MYLPFLAVQKHKNSFKNISLLAVTSVLVSGCFANNPNHSNNTSTKNSSAVYANNSLSAKTPDVTPDKLTDDLKLRTQEALVATDVWQAFNNQFRLANRDFGKYDKYIEFYKKRKPYLETVSRRAQPYLHYIYEEVQKRQIPFEIALLPIIESSFKASARSSQRAVGLWQFIPSTAELYDLDRSWWYDGRKDITKSTQAALNYLEKLQRLNNGDWLLALASYNAGLGNVYKAQRKFRKANKQIKDIAEYQPNFWQIQKYLPKETQAYVPKLFAVAYLVDNAKRFNIKLAPVANQQFFTKIKLDKQVALNQVASLSGTSKELLKTLNPGYHQMATPPTGPHDLLLPTDKAEQFRQQLNSNQDIYAIQWHKYKIRSGDSLGIIAQKHKTSLNIIKALNGMKNSKIRAGKTLLIPIPADKTGLVETQFANTKQLAQSKQKNQPKHWHTVKTGDSLWKLARYYNVSTATICQWNNISIKSPLRSGQKIAIHSHKYGTKITHKLKNGENLWLVAKRYKVTTQDIAGWNQISTKKVLQPGMNLTIWTPKKINQHIVKNGDNLWLIAKNNQLSAQQLAKFNKLSLQKPLQPGQVILIPYESSNQS